MAGRAPQGVSFKLGGLQRWQSTQILFFGVCSHPRCGFLQEGEEGKTSFPLFIISCICRLYTGLKKFFSVCIVTCNTLVVNAISVTKAFVTEDVVLFPKNMELSLLKGSMFFEKCPIYF
jgi:hypothetical protein